MLNRIIAPRNHSLIAIACFCVASSRSFILSQTKPKLGRRPLYRMSTTAAEDPLKLYQLPQPLILGSASFTRKLILKEMGVNYHILVRPIDEKSLGDRSQDKPEDLVLKLANAKMDHLLNEISAGRCDDELPDSSQEEWIILTGDQVVTCNGDILEKPESIEEAKSFAARYQTHPPSTVGSVVLAHLPSGIRIDGVDIATIYFNAVPDDLVDKMLEDNAPILSCAGGLMVEHDLVRECIDRIDGTEDSVMGLSKDLVTRLLCELSDKLSAVGN